MGKAWLMQDGADSRLLARHLTFIASRVKADAY